MNLNESSDWRIIWLSMYWNIKSDLYTCIIRQIWHKDRIKSASRSYLKDKKLARMTSKYFQKYIWTLLKYIQLSVLSFQVDMEKMWDWRCIWYILGSISLFTKFSITCMKGFQKYEYQLKSRNLFLKTFKSLIYFSITQVGD